MVAEYAIGKELKDAAMTPGMWSIGMGGFGEFLPNHDNRVTLDKDKKDKDKNK